MISAPYLPDIFYLAAASKRVASAFPEYSSRFYFTIDGEEGNTLGVIDNLISNVGVYHKNLIYGTGISACAPLQYKDVSELFFFCFSSFAFSFTKFSTKGNDDGICKQNERCDWICLCMDFGQRRFNG